MIMEMISGIQANVEVLLWGWAICQMSFCYGLGRRLAGAGIFAADLVLYFLLTDAASFAPVHLVMHMACFLVLFEGGPGKKAVQYLFSVFYLKIVYTPVYMIGIWAFYLSGAGTVPMFWKGTASLISCAVILLIGILIKKRKYWSGLIRLISWKYYALGFACAFAADGIFAFAERVMEGMDYRAQALMGSMRVAVTILLYGLGLGFALADILRRRYKQESALKDEYLRISGEHFASLKEHAEEIRRIRHDIRAHLDVLAMYLGRGDIDGARGYLKEVREGDAGIYEWHADVGNDVVNAVVAEEVKRRGGQTEVACKGMLPGSIQVSDFDLCTIFSNVVSNGLEACARLQNTEKRFYLSVRKTMNQVLITAENPVEWDVDLERLGTFSSKKDGKSHGYGIYQINSTVEKNQGDVRYHAEDGLFRVEILLHYQMQPGS